MDGKLPLLPLGTSEFKKIRVKGRKYVDKTKYIPLLKEYGDVLFFARPRRFGKSLAISTMDSFFSGDKDLFKGLAAEEIMNSPDFVPRPVIRLTMSAPSGSKSADILEKNIIFALTKIADRHEVTPRGVDAADTFWNLIRDVKKANKNNNVVLLIDEYDAPVIKVIQDPGLSKIGGLLEDTRTVVSNFYSKIKDLDEDLDFVFITGVTKFSRMGVFSALNNLKDISLLPGLASFVGFTQEELENNFRPFIRQTAEKFQLSEPELLAKIQEYYNGFSFDGKMRLYNPQSMLNFFKDMEFDNYWMKSGSKTLIREMMKDKNLMVELFSGLQVTRDFVNEPGEIDNTSPEGFLYQAGYLTLRKDPDFESSYFLDYPNFEVRSSMSKLFMDIVFRSERNADDASRKLKEHFDAGDVAGFVH
ncbi:MAG: AAA family ATPase, partial [Deltaproteobacteria bacterium]|nr:AAA family ATPase [Deltaproteobacteria bacterium]